MRFQNVFSGMALVCGLALGGFLLLVPGHSCANSLNLPKREVVPPAPVPVPPGPPVFVPDPPKPDPGPVVVTPEPKPQPKPVYFDLKDDTKIDVLEGKWRCDSGLSRVSDNEPVVLEFSFDKNGNGTSWIREKNGKLFETKVKANIRDRELTIKTEGGYTSKDSKGGYTGLTIKCRQKGDFASCNGKHDNNGPEWSDAFFERVN